jgi:uncharacterized membrane protein
MWPLIIIQWLHVFFGIFWFGSALYVDFVLIPAVTTLPLDQQRAVSKPISTVSARVIIPASLLAIALGILRGTIWGPVQSVDTLFGNAYGMTFLIGFIAALATFLWGLLVTTRAAQRLDTFPVAEVMQSGSPASLAFAAQLQRVKLFAMLELLGFFLIFTCMILMRFGM